jgi:metal-responsive CopG/Arc/MetJ family transcriptional regulator
MGKRKPDDDGPGMVRRSVSLPADECAELERIANEKRVSVSWVVRDAVSQYLASRTPLFHQNVPEENQRQ